MSQTDGPVSENDLLPSISVFTRGEALSENDLLPSISVFTRGEAEVRVSDADRNCLVGVKGSVREGTETQIVELLYRMRSVTSSQCELWRI